MKNLWHIIRREYFSRVRKKTFLLMCVLGPVLFSLLFIIPAWIEHREESEIKVIAVVDSSHLFYNKITNTSLLKFVYLDPAEFKEIRRSFREKGYWGLLYISHVITYTPSGVILFSYQYPSLSIKLHIRNCLEKEIERRKLLAHHISGLENVLQAVKTNINLRVVKLYEGGEEDEPNDNLSVIVAWVSGMIIYFFIFFFGSQVMRGIMEEKNSRVVEIIFSSVQPLELMMGKIIGIGMAGLTQFIVWCFLTVAILNVSGKMFFPELFLSPAEIAVAQDIMNVQQAKDVDESSMAQSETAAGMKELIESIDRINFGFILFSFLLFFTGGYLLYASLYAAIGAAGNTEMDVHQFMLPVTIPLMLAIFLLFNTVYDPDSDLNVFASLFPLTSSIIMMARIPYGVKLWEYIFSVIILFFSFFFVAWLSSRIYKRGILRYGKKTRYRELWKWLTS